LGTDQAYIQRYFATRSLSEARKSILLDGLINIPVCALLLLLGTVLYVYYHHFPQRLVGMPVRDAILPFFVINEIPGIVSGLIIASLFAASMAVMSAGINSLATVTTVDFYHRLFRKDGKDANVVRVGRIGTLCWGAVATIGALFAGHLGPLVTAFNYINSFVAGPILGIFLLGMLTVRAKSTATILGAIVGLLIVSVTAAESRISFFYFSFIGVCVTCISGYLLSLVGPAIDPSRLKGLVWMRRSQDWDIGIQGETKGTEIGSKPNQGELNASR
jgi:SSS family solute:Na+ symporter